MNDTQTNADCSLLQTRYQQACACGESDRITDKARDLESEANEKDCGWAEGTSSYSCTDYCG
jgi:hypothetical protein